MTAKEWIVNYQNGLFDISNDEALLRYGWIDWFCSNELAFKKTLCFGDLFSDLNEIGRFNLNNIKFCFKNNRILGIKDYDDVRFIDNKTGVVLLIIQFNCEYNMHKIVVFERKNGKFDIVKSTFECDDLNDLILWLNCK